MFEPTDDYDVSDSYADEYEWNQAVLNGDIS